MKSMLKVLLKDEKKAPRDYHKLLKQTKLLSQRKVIRGIIRDEKHHYQLLTKFKRK